MNLWMLWLDTLRGFVNAVVAIVAAAWQALGDSVGADYCQRTGRFESR
jgi:hypothetical protein